MPKLVAAGRFRGYLLLLHPGPSLVCTLVTAVSGWSSARGAVPTAPGLPRRAGRRIAWASSAMALAQVSTGILNDAVDAPSDRLFQPYKPIARGAVPRGHAWGLAALTGVAALTCARQAGPAAERLMRLGLASGWAYSLGLSRSPLSFLPFASGLATVPRLGPAALGRRPERARTLTALSALLGVALHLANGAPDADRDRQAGRRSLPVLLGPHRSRRWSRRLLGWAAVAAALDNRPHLRWRAAAGSVACLAMLGIDRALDRPGREVGQHPFVLPALGGGALALGWLLDGSAPSTTVTAAAHLL